MAATMNNTTISTSTMDDFHHDDDDDDDSSVKTLLRIIGTGIVMGCIHVLTGPDHLSALATLSANVGNSKAFVLGIQWGIGHSTGLLVVALILVLTTDSGSALDVSPTVGHFLESIVGVFMLTLGSVTMIKAYYQKKKRQREMVVLRQKLCCNDCNDDEESCSLLLKKEEDGHIDTTTNDKQSNSYATFPSLESSSPRSDTTTTDTSCTDDDDDEEKCNHHLTDNKLSTSSTSNNTMIKKLHQYQHQNNVNHIHLTETGNELVVAQMMHTSTGTTSNQKNLFQTIVDCLFVPHTHIEDKDTLLNANSERSISLKLMNHTHDEEAQEMYMCCQRFGRTLLPCCWSSSSSTETKQLDTNTWSGKLVAFAAGIIHGLAGPGGILGVIPAMHMKTSTEACLYLSCFCFASTCIMGIFATLYGNISDCLSKTSGGNTYFVMELVSSSFSILVGIVWLTLLAIGKLDQVFD